eukprot:GEMP01022434.1.p1 GENE.GEMP01022434.1~~GEMP01022434.1.p1  ORF type:complete len:312 (-),score=59.99 GEMP01022434.1:1461-2396(-)
MKWCLCFSAKRRPKKAKLPEDKELPTEKPLQVPTPVASPPDIVVTSAVEDPLESKPSTRTGQNPQRVRFHQEMCRKILSNNQKLLKERNVARATHAVEVEPLIIYCKGFGLKPGYHAKAHDDPQGWLFGFGVGSLDRVIAYQDNCNARRPPKSNWVVPEDMLFPPDGKIPGLRLEVYQSPRDGMKSLIEVRGFRNERYNGIFAKHQISGNWGRGTVNNHETDGYVRVAALVDVDDVEEAEMCEGDNELDVISLPSTHSSIQSVRSVPHGAPATRFQALIRAMEKDADFDPARDRGMVAEHITKFDASVAMN